ncbi:hypothetical protein OHS33_37095 [Streptomyces sp. NBC_00536]|nr:hypothetical protein [Streptomyces sp. NBC_00536]WUC83482.1 hypothetical protein OHS33_37095 [Streptomyces sp. NBC_00536]
MTSLIIVHCAHNLDGWEENWSVSLEELNREAVEAPTIPEQPVWAVT